MSVFGFDARGCKELRVIGYTLQGGKRTDITAAVIEAEYSDGTMVEVTVDLEMNLGAFLATVAAINKRLADLNP